MLKPVTVAIMCIHLLEIFTRYEVLEVLLRDESTVCILLRCVSTYTVYLVFQVPGIFISRLVQGGLAESTGLLAVNDEVLEVNGIEVTGKSLDQVTDMMVANSSNLIITVKPVNQTNTLASSSARHHPHRRSGVSVGSNQSAVSIDSDEVKDLMLKDDDEDEVKDHSTVNEMHTATLSSKTSDQSSDVVTL